MADEKGRAAESREHSERQDCAGYSNTPSDGGCFYLKPKPYTSKKWCEFGPCAFYKRREERKNDQL
jgi:hypothetical protein